MPILYHFRTRGTGAEAVHIAGIACAFEKMGHEVVLSSPTGVDPRQTAGSTPFAEPRSRSGAWIARLPRGIFELFEVFYNIPAFFRNLHLVRRHRCELIYERHAFFLFSTALVAKFCRCPLVVEVNELVGDSRIRAQPIFSSLARWSDRFLFRRARLIVAVSPHLKRRIQEYGIPAERILVLPNAVAEEDLAIPSKPMSFDLPGAFLLGFAGWLVEWHRLDFLVEALADPAFSTVILVIIGDGPLRQPLETQARSLGVRVHFTGALPHAEVPAALRAMDACVIPHTNEYRSPIKLFQFMAQERAVLASRTEPIESVVRDGTEALLFTPMDISSLQSVLQKLLNSSQLREVLGRSARRLVEERHTWEKNAKAVMDALN